MPNFNPEDVPSDPESLSQRQTSPAPDTQSSGFDQSPTVHDASLETIEPQQSSHAGGFLDQFDDEDPEAAAWDLSNPAETDPMQQEDHEPGSNAEEAAADEPPSEPAVTSNAAKHSSTISFARTVSHEVSFMDDEEVEWNVQRTDTDPFDFMGPDDRTNTFPAVPPTTDEQSDSPPPLTQAQDILHDMEKDVSSPDLGGWSAHEHGQPETEESVLKDESFQQFVGGELAGTEQEAADARFEEGLPLISHEEAEQPAANSQDLHPTVDDLFANEDDGDDFFSQAKNEAQSSLEEDDFDHTLHRKSTAMVLGEAMQSAEAPTGADLGIPSPTEEKASKVQSAVTEQKTEAVNGGTNSDAAPTDVDAKWAAAFGDDDDDFLLETASESKDKELDPNEIFGSDDEGFLEDTAETSAAPPTQPAASSTPGLNGHYAPGHLQYQQPQSPYSPYAPQQTMSQPQLMQHPSYVQSAVSTPTASSFAPPPRPDLPKPQSFVDKSKGGYQSPYDLPMEVVKPKKRASMLQLPRTTSTLPAPPSGPPSGPPRSASMYSQPPPPSGGSTASLSPSGSSHSPQLPPPPKTQPPLKNKPSFFEDLPMTSRPRPGSRHSTQPSPSHPSPYIQQGPPRGPLSAQLLPSPGLQPPALASPAVSPPMLSPPVFSPPMSQGSQTLSPGMPSLVAPELVSPYANLQAPPQPPVSTAPASNRYSPAPPPVANGGVPPPAAASRYSPAPPPVARSHSVGYTPASAPPPPPALPHQPRTSSPLAHFEITNEKHANKVSGPVHADGVSIPRANSHYEPRLTRLPSLPPTQEVEEESPSVASPPVVAKSNAASSPAESRYSPRQTSHTPPPVHSQPSSVLSPPKRPASNYMPQTQPVVQREANFVPPPRPQTQSPTAFRQSDHGIKPVDAIPRPSSVQGPTSPRILHSMQPMQPVVRARGISQSLSLIPPTDGREVDPLERWKGAPLIQWGVGGVLVTSFTKDIPRYGMNQSLPMIMRSPGEVKIKHIKDIQPLDERLAKFPGPLKGKGKKKEGIAWLTAGIENLESSLPNAAFQQNLSHEDKRAIERVLLLKILRVFVENDGVVEGSPAVEKAVRDIISPGLSSENPDVTPAITSGVDLTGIASSMTNMQADSIDSSAVEQIRSNLLSGDREKAVWAAVDKRLWGHAMLIANTSQNTDLYKQVAQEFIKKEVNYPGHNNESLAALYSVLSTNFDECVDELVPVHARAGLQLMSTTATTGGSKDALVGLDKWRETLGMILSNRSQGDVKALTSLGNLLSTYGRAEAAHICYIFARTHAVFGGLDDPNAHFVLVGADHRRQADQFGKDTESLLLSEVYEYGLSLTGGLNVLQGCPHLAAYKLQHAATLAEHGFKEKALQYCEAIANAMMAQTKRSPYYNHVLESAVDDLAKRLKLAPKEGSSSWISKPSMDKVSSNMWTRFNKFVAGEDTDAAGDAPAGESGGEVGPFSRIAGGTPTISPSPSMTNFEVYANGGLGGKPSSAPTMPTTRAASRYGPAAPQTSSNPYDPNGGYSPAPRSSLDRTSGEYTRKSNEIRRPSYGNPYSPETSSRPTTGYQATSAASQSSPYTPAFQASPPEPASSQLPTSSYPGYTPYNANQSSPNTAAAGQAAPESSANGAKVPQPQGYQPISYGYEPPSINTFEPPSTQTEDSSTGGGYEPPSFQPSTFEPPSYEPDPEDDSRESRPKKKTIFDDDDDDIPALKQPQEKSKSEKDRENEELFRKVAEEEAKRAAEAKPAKKGWGLGSWFGGGGKKDEQPGNKPIKAKLGEQSSFVYDPDLKRWVNKKPGAENIPAKTATPPPPRSNSATRVGTGTPPPPMASHSAPPPSLSRPPSAAPSPAMGGGLAPPQSQDSLLAPPMMKRSVSNQSIASIISDASGAGPPGPTRSPSMPPGRPTTSLSNASSIDDLLGAAGTRRAGSRKPRKSGRYVDVMAK
ncbi:vesicle coat component [Diatrype stigma]|uniref:Protein transport protein sec16 n=1 Tax=Diatrype stigma TaxID=117547 RepID=A0AAN9ULR3_9PEZI